VLGTGTASLGNAAFAEIRGVTQYDYAGSGLAAAGDVTGDGQQDLWIGASGYDDTDGVGITVGAVLLWTGPVVEGIQSLANADALLWGEQPEAAIGTILAAADFDGDGLSDLAVGSPTDTEVEIAAGAVYLVRGDATGTYANIETVSSKILADTGKEALGSSVADAGDVDGDGLHDLLVGAPDASTTAAQAGVAYLILGDRDLAAFDGVPASELADTSFLGETSGDRAGSAVAGNGDFDGDGNLDYLIGAETRGDSDEGAAYLVLGPVSGARTLELGSEGAMARIVGSVLDDDIGGELEFARLEKSRAAIILGAENDDVGGVDAGAAYVVFDVGM
jgi:hypothetical protein